MYNHSLAIPSVSAHSEPNEKYTPLIEVNQAIHAIVFLDKNFMCGGW